MLSERMTRDVTYIRSKGVDVVIHNRVGNTELVPQQFREAGRQVQSVE